MRMLDRRFSSSVGLREVDDLLAAIKRSLWSGSGCLKTTCWSHKSRIERIQG